MMFRVLEKQCENRTSRDWVTTVISDLDVLGLDYTFAEIQEMNKTKWKSIVKLKVAENSFKILEDKKKKHSKVENINHEKLKMQPYFLPNKDGISAEDIKWIFRIRCREVKVKMNLQGLYDSFECEMCMKEDETQEHVYKCKEIRKLRNNVENDKEYERIMNGNTEEQVAIARVLQENMKILDR